MKWGKCNFKQLKDMQKRVERLSKFNLDLFYQQCAKELAARLLALVIKRTPVGERKGGTLRRGWTSKTAESAANGTGKGAKAWAQSLKITHNGKDYMIEIVNPVKYASYVEYGHRTADHKGWVPGRFMMTVSAQELEQKAPQIIERKLLKFMEDIFNGK